jgi:hypothetical protein
MLVQWSLCKQTRRNGTSQVNLAMESPSMDRVTIRVGVEEAFSTMSHWAVEIVTWPPTNRINTWANRSKDQTTLTMRLTLYSNCFLHTWWQVRQSLILNWWLKMEQHYSKLGWTIQVPTRVLMSTAVRITSKPEGPGDRAWLKSYLIQVSTVRLVVSLRKSNSFWRWGETKREPRKEVAEKVVSSALLESSSRNSTDTLGIAWRLQTTTPIQHSMKPHPLPFENKPAKACGHWPPIPHLKLPLEIMAVYSDQLRSHPCSLIVSLLAQ